MIDPDLYTIDFNQHEVSMAGLYKIAEVLNTYGRANIRNSGGLDILRLGLGLVVEFEKMRSKQEGR